MLDLFKSMTCNSHGSMLPSLLNPAKAVCFVNLANLCVCVCVLEPALKKYTMGLLIDLNPYQSLSFC